MVPVNELWLIRETKNGFEEKEIVPWCDTVISETSNLETISFPKNASKIMNNMLQNQRNINRFIKLFNKSIISVQ